MVVAHMKRSSPRVRVRSIGLALLLSLPIACIGAGQQTFATPEAAIDHLVTALQDNDDVALLALFGDRHKDLVITGDPANDAAVRAQAAAHLATFRALEERGNDRRVLLMGAQAWPFPIPLLREDNAWRFATEQGVEELLNRRIGSNERNAIYVLRAYVDAQREYASVDRNGDGVLQYASKIVSAPGRRDGLYWPADAGTAEAPSPFGPLIAASSEYLAGHKPGDAYRGYHFRILTRQGKRAPGGAYSYTINGRMIAGFAMVAYPDAHGATGVMSFIVNHNGKVYERNLGPNTAAVAVKMSSFDPGPGWNEVGP